jgi:S1-C subfamily serine protease
MLSADALRGAAVISIRYSLGQIEVALKSKGVIHSFQQAFCATLRAAGAAPLAAVLLAVLLQACIASADDEAANPSPATPKAQPPATAQANAPQQAVAVDASHAAEQLLNCTCTVRITRSKATKGIAKAVTSAAAAKEGAAKPAAAPAAATPATGDEGVDVCSGVSLGSGLIVTFHRGTSEDRVRVTFPGGEQSLAQTAVVDEFSSLVLLELDRKTMPKLELADGPPKIGSAVVTGAASGIEKPVISLGILGGVDRALPGSGLPPLLQCDVRTTESSSGAAIVDAQGKLVGVIAATSAAGNSGGWTYAVPASHIRRLLRARVPGQFTMLRRLRPAIGLTMGPGAEEGTVRVERVDAGGPAEKAGIKAGDEICETDGRKVRSAYQAVDLILKKQPGDEIELVVRQDGKEKPITLTLEATPARLGSALAKEQRIRIMPQLNVRALSRNQIEVAPGRLVEVAADAATPDEDKAEGKAAYDKPGAANGKTGRDELSMLQKQLTAFEKVITVLQTELQNRDNRQRETDAVVKTLSEEVAKLRKQLEAAPK